MFLLAQHGGQLPPGNSQLARLFQQGYHIILVKIPFSFFHNLLFGSLHHKHAQPAPFVHNALVYQKIDALEGCGRIDFVADGYFCGGGDLRFLRECFRQNRILDPFRMKKEEADWFFLNPLTGTLSPNPALSARRRRAVENTIQALGLNQKIFCDYRLDLLNLLEQDDGAESLRCESPFLLAEAVRLRLL